MKKIATRFLPNSRFEWKSFMKLSIFSLIQTLMFSINGFIDNLMVGNIYKEGQIVDGIQIKGAMVKQLNEAAVEGLAAAAQWWFLVVTIGTFFVGAVGFFTAQYYGKGDMVKTQRSMTTKFQIACFVAVPIAIVMIIVPEPFIAAWTHKSIDHSHSVTEFSSLSTINPSYANYLGAKYIRIAAISWLIWALVNPQNNSLRDLGKPQGGALALFFTLITHVGLNIIFIKTTNLGVEGPAIALLCSRVINFAVTATYIRWKQLPISIFANPFIWDREIWGKWIRRYSYLIYAIIWTLAIVFRTFFWGMYFHRDDLPSNATPDQQEAYNKAVDALVVLGIAGSIQNIFLVAFDALQPLFARYISGSMAKDQMKEAKGYADRIVGFGVLLSLVISLLLVGISFAVPYFGSDGANIWNVNKETLSQVRECILVVALVYFSWVILASVRTIMSSGSRATTMAWIDGGFTVFQTVYIVVIGVIHKYTGAFSDFGLAYLVFYVSDIAKLPFFLIPFYKLEWTKNHTKVETKEVVKA